MEAIITFGPRGLSGCAGSLISVALVLCGTSSRAEGITVLGFADAPAAGMVGNFSRGDLEELEYAGASEATAARLAAYEAATPPSQEVRPRVASPEDAAPIELFPHSGRVMPLLTTTPAAVTSVTRSALAIRPGQARPVGVSLSSLRSPTPSERAAR